jgi:hypothetical protein
MEPRGAVITIAKTAVVMIICPHSTNYFEADVPASSAVVRIIPPMAACTVALGIQAIEMNICSLKLYLCLLVMSIAPPILAIRPQKSTTRPLPIIDGSILSNLTDAPTVPNRRG